mgnify:CR=1 FL=1
MKFLIPNIGPDAARLSAATYRASYYASAFKSMEKAIALRLHGRGFRLRDLFSRQGEANDIKHKSELAS